MLFWIRFSSVRLGKISSDLQGNSDMLLYPIFRWVNLKSRLCKYLLINKQLHSVTKAKVEIKTYDGKRDSIPWKLSHWIELPDTAKHFTDSYRLVGMLSHTPNLLLLMFRNVIFSPISNRSNILKNNLVRFYFWKRFSQFEYSKFTWFQSEIWLCDKTHSVTLLQMSFNWNEMKWNKIWKNMKIQISK